MRQQIEVERPARPATNGWRRWPWLELWPEPAAARSWPDVHAEARVVEEQSPRPPTLILNPAGDAAFVEWTSRLTAGSGVGPGELQESLRSRYPRAIVRRRELSGEPFEVWYVYRDGRWRPPFAGREEDR